MKFEAKVSEPISAIMQEFCKIASSDCFARQLTSHQEIFTSLIPELNDMIGFDQKNPHHEYDVFHHTVHAIEHCQAEDIIVRLAVFFHDFGKPHSYQEEDGIRHFKGHGRVSADMADDIMKRMEFDPETRKSVVELVYYHDASFAYGKKYIKRWLNKLGEIQFRRLLQVRKADIKGQKADYEEERLQILSDIEKLIDEVLLEKESLSVKDLTVGGRDLIGIGYQPGWEIGRALDKLLERVIEEEVENEKEPLLELAKEWLLEKR